MSRLLSTAVKTIVRLRKTGAEGVSIKLLWGAFEISAAFASDSVVRVDTAAVAGFVVGESDE
jgi:hypothetical protein